MPTDFWQRFVPVQTVGPVTDLITIPTFNVPAVPGVDGLGASTLFARFTFSIPSFWAVLPVLVPPVSSFVLAVSDRGNRYLFWKGIGEILNYPLYTGEPLSSAAVFECWTSQQNTATLTNTAFNLQTGITTPQTDFRTKTPVIHTAVTAIYYPN